MDKLQPILKFHFWILLFIAMVMAFVGWWMTTGQMQAAIATRRAAIDTAKGKIPSNEDAAKHPNKDWEDKLAAINAKQDQLLNYSKLWLYQKQKEAMVWPKWLPEEARHLKYGEEFKDNRHKTIYRNNYMEEVLRVYRIPQPIEDPMDPNGIVMFPFSEMPHREWGDITPSSKQIWDSMEDLWLLQPILTAVYEANGGERATRHDASVVAIQYVQLHGGDRSKIGQASGGAMGGGDEAMPGMGGAGAMPMGAGLGHREDGGGGGFGRSSGPGGPAFGDDINPVDEFGDPGAGGGMGGGADGARMMDVETPGANVGYSNSASIEDTSRRYIDDDEAQPYKTRGFKLTVIMDHRKVPDLYAQLTSSEQSPWPIKITRMNISDFHGGGSMGGGAGGFNRGGDEDDRPSRGGGGFGGNMPFGNGGGFGGGGFGGGANPAGLPGTRKPGGPGGAAVKGRIGISRGGDEQDVVRGSGAGPGQENPLEKPYLARVTFLGLITMYREPKQLEGTTSAGAPSTETTGTESPSADAASTDDSSAASEADVDPNAAATFDEDQGTMPADGSASELEPADEAAKPDADADGEMKLEDDAVPAEDSPAKPFPDSGDDEPGTAPESDAGKSGGGSEPTDSDQSADNNQPSDSKE